MIVLSLAAALALALLHRCVRLLSPVLDAPRSPWLSAAGGAAVNTMKDEIPQNGSGNAPAFALGAVAHAALLLAL